MKLIDEHSWVRNHTDEVEKFSGKWIAVWNEQIIAGDDDLEVVAKEAKQKYKDSKPLFIKVPREDEEVYIL